MIFSLLGAVYLGWSLGANDAANSFGTAVSSRMLKFITAGLLAAIFVILGSVLGGSRGLRTIGTLTTQDLQTAGIVSFGAAIAVTVMTILRLPVSTSQAVVGAILGVGILHQQVNATGLVKILLCWLFTPAGGCVIAVILYRCLAVLFNVLDFNVVIHDLVLKAGLIIAGCYSAFALGANNVANVTGVLFGAELLSEFSALLLGGAAISIGIVTFSRGVMSTVGKGIVNLDAYSALIVVISEAVTVHIYAIIGVPVSTSQALIGAVIGIGALKRAEAIKTRAIYGILSGWVVTPLLAGLLSMFMYFLFHLDYTG
jgi:PiT family inorganic phosphate transporter